MFNKSYNVAAAERANKELAHSFVKYTVKLLDDSIETLQLSTETHGMNLLDSVCDLLELLERDYFGIQYRSDEAHGNTPIWKWLKMDKLVRKQIKNDFMSKTFYLRVRFVPVDVNQMLEIYTRYQLFLQIKQDIYNGRIVCPKDIAVQLAGCVLQSELGDFNTLKTGYVGEFRFIHDQNPTFEADVANFHKTLRGIRAEDAELKFLTIAKQMLQYGCDLYNCEFMDKPIQFGFNAIGISMFPSEGEPFIIPWSALDKILNKNKYFLITVLNIQSIVSLLEGGASHSMQIGTKAKLSTFREKLGSGFKLIFQSTDEAKEAWKSCIESHSFFRVRDPKQIQGSNSVKRSHSFFKLTSVPSLFSGRRTLPEILDIRRRSRTLERSFIRTPSKRFTKKNVVQSEKQSVISATESHRPSATLHGKVQKSNLSSINSSKIKPVETRKEPDISESESSGHSGNDDFEPEPGQLRPKSFMTQSVRLENNNQFVKSSMTHASMPRKGPNRPSKSLAIDNEKKEPNFNDTISKSVPKGEYNAPKNTNQKASISDVKSQSLVKSKLTGSLSSMKNPLANTNGGINQSTDKLADMDSYVEISMKALDNKYGFTIRGGIDTGSHVIVTKVSSGSAANICVPNLFEGDQIIKINEKYADDLTNDEIKEIIRSTGQKKDSLLVLTVKPRLYIADESVTNEEMSTEEDEAKIVVNDLRTEIKLLEESLKNGTAVAQFEKLYKQKQGLSMNEAKKPENLSKNRYKDILPYDQTRVLIRNGDYINANLIKFDIPKTSSSYKYIAAQGPLTHTANDFLTMIWENKTQLVVMLTDLQEKGRSKCFKYWPNLGETTKLPNGLQITCESESIRSTFAIREMKLKKANDMRKFTHLQYLYWPDHDVPQKMEEFTSFIKTMKQIRSNKSEPTVVHCSAGIGRTGVVITMDIAIAHIELKQPFSVLALVKEIRNQRAMLIQSQKQYDFVCRAIINYYSNYSK